MQPVNANPVNDQVERVYFEIDEDKLDQWEKPQIKESKKAFFYATIRYCTVLHDITWYCMIFFISDGGDKEKMECFVDFCEDAIFEMQHSASLVEEDSEEGKVGAKMVRRGNVTLLFADCTEIRTHNAERGRAKRPDSTTQGAGRPRRRGRVPCQHGQVDGQDEDDVPARARPPPALLGLLGGLRHWRDRSQHPWILPLSDARILWTRGEGCHQG